MTNEAVHIDGMTCDHCVRTVTQALESIEGIREVTVDLAGGRAQYVAAEPIDREIIRAAVRRAGYEPID